MYALTLHQWPEHLIKPHHVRRSILNIKSRLTEVAVRDGLMTLTKKPMDMTVLPKFNQHIKPNNQLMYQ
jgi:hypothetical protein